MSFLLTVPVAVRRCCCPCQTSGDEPAALGEER